MLSAMSFLDRLRNLLAGPARVQGDSADAAALHEELGTPDAGAADVRRVETATGGYAVPGLADSEAAEAAEADLGTEEAPPDPEP